MDAAARNYQKNKNKKRTVPELDAGQTRLLVELMAANAPTGEIARKLDIGEIDLDIILNRLGITSMDDAKVRLKEYAKEDAVSEDVATANREEARKATQEAQERFNKQNASVAEDNEEKAQVAREGARDRQDKMKDEDAARQREFGESKPKTSNLLQKYSSPSTHYVGASVQAGQTKETGKFPAKMEKSVFRDLLLQRGLCFIREKYGVTNDDIRAEMAARNITNLDFDLLPR